MQRKQHWGDMTVSGCLSDESRCGILDTLQFGKMHGWCTIEKTVAIINAYLYKAVSWRQASRTSLLVWYNVGDGRLIDKSCWSITWNHAPRLRTAELTIGTDAWPISRCAISIKCFLVPIRMTSVISSLSFSWFAAIHTLMSSIPAHQPRLQFGCPNNPA